jgi:hypothetical protein
MPAMVVRFNKSVGRHFNGGRIARTLGSTLPLSGRARYGVGKLPLFGKPRAWRWFRKQDHAAIEKSLFDPFIVGPTDRLSVFLAFPKPNGTFVYSERFREVSLRHASKSAGCTQLPPLDKIIIAPVRHGLTCCG